MSLRGAKAASLCAARKRNATLAAVSAHTPSAMNFGLGEFFSLASAGAWAVGVILYRRLGETLPPLALNFLKNSLVLGLMLPAVPLLHGFEVPSFTAIQIGLALASGFIGIALADTLYFRALNELGAGRMGIIGNLYSPLVILLSFAFLGERLSAMQIAGFLLVTVGVLTITKARQAENHPLPGPLLEGEGAKLEFSASEKARAEDELSEAAGERSELSAPKERSGEVAAVEGAKGGLEPSPSRRGLGEDGVRRRKGLLLGVLSIALMAVAIVMVKRVLEAQPLMWVTSVRLIGAVGGLFVIALLTGNLHRLRPQGAKFDWRLLVAAAVFGQFLAMVLWLAGYKYTQASIAAILNETSSVFIVVLAWLWLHEPLGRRGAIGVSLTLAGVVLMLF
jgi:drug/metabolite transporter (DMT)-like permease